MSDDEKQDNVASFARERAIKKTYQPSPAIKKVFLVVETDNELCKDIVQALREAYPGHDIEFITEDYNTDELARKLAGAAQNRTVYDLVVVGEAEGSAILNKPEKLKDAPLLALTDNVSTQTSLNAMGKAFLPRAAFKDSQKKDDALQKLREVATDITYTPPPKNMRYFSMQPMPDAPKILLVFQSDERVSALASQLSSDYRERRGEKCTLEIVPGGFEPGLILNYVNLAKTNQMPYTMAVVEDISQPDGSSPLADMIAGKNMSRGERLVPLLVVTDHPERFENIQKERRAIKCPLMVVDRRQYLTENAGQEAIIDPKALGEAVEKMLGRLQHWSQRGNGAER